MRKLFARLEVADQGDRKLEVMGLKYFTLSFIILGIGIVISTVVWAIELGTKTGRWNQINQRS